VNTETGVIEVLYRRWIAFVFDRTNPDWHVEPDAGEFEAEGDHAVMSELPAMRWRRAGEDLRHYKDVQVNAEVRPEPLA